MLILASTILLLAIALGAPSDAPTPPAKTQESELVPFTLKLVAGDQRRLRWSPKGRKIDFDASPDPDLVRQAEADLGLEIFDPATAIFPLGHEGVVPPVRMVSCRTDADGQWAEQLIIDVNRDGRFDPATEVFDTTATENRGRMWVSFGNVPIDIVAPDGERIRHRFSFWRVYPAADEPQEFHGIRLTRRSWMEGFATINDARYRIALIDGNNDGRYTRLDRWVIAADDGTPESSKAAEQHIASPSEGAAPIAPCFIGEQAFRLMDVNLAATKAAVRMSLDLKPIVVKPPSRPKADAGPTWETNLDAARAKASISGQRILLKWTADWCGPCKAMDKGAFMDREVVGLVGDGFIPVKLDFDAHRALAREMRVNAIPTLHVFAPDGSEITRHTGLLDPAAMVEFLRGAKAGPETTKSDG